MNRSVSILALIVTATLALAGAAGAAPSAQDQQFVTKAAQAGLAEVKLAALALRKSKAPQVVSFADHMRHDHSQANAQLAAIAKAQELTLPAGVGAQNSMLMTKLEALSGSAFDAAYLKSQLPAHERALALFEHEAAGGQDRQLVAFAKRTIPVIEKHIAWDKRDTASLGQSVGMSSAAK